MMEVKLGQKNSFNTLDIERGKFLHMNKTLKDTRNDLLNRIEKIGW